MNGNRGVRPHPYNRSGFSSSASKQIVGSSGKVVPFNQCQNVEIAPAKNNEQILINSYNVRLPQRPVFQYELKFYGIRRDGKTVDFVSLFTQGIELKLVREYITQMYDILFTENQDFFQYYKNDNDEYDHVYVYDRASTFYCSLELVDRDLTNPFMLNKRNLNPELKGFLQTPENFIATLKLTKQLAMNPDAPEGDQCLEQYMDILLSQNQYDNIQNFVKVKEGFFELQNGKDISCGGQLNIGHIKSVRISKKSAVLQIRIAFAPFHQALPLIDYVFQRWSIKPDHDWFSKRNTDILFQLRNMYVQTTYGRYPVKFFIANISFMSAEKMTMDFNGEKISIVEYFRRKYTMELKYPKLPCVRRKSKTKEEYFPFELLKIVEGQTIRDLEPQQRQKMIEQSQMLPDKNKIEIQNQMNQICNPKTYISPAQIEISTTMNSITSEILNPPIITYKNNDEKQVNFAQWRSNDIEYVEPVEINVLAVFYDEQRVRKDIAETAAFQIKQHAIKYGMKFHGTDFLPLSKDIFNRKELENTIIDHRDKFQCDYVLAFVEGTAFHNMLKATEIKTKVVTQQVEPKTIIQNLNQAKSGIVHKMNLKRGGYNNYFRQANPSQINSENIDLFQSFMQKTMLFGIAIVHPDSGNPEQPSVFGYAFSTNKYGNVADNGYVYMKARQNVLSDAELRKPLENAAKSYYEKNKCYPQRILVYRCGASDGEIQRIQNEECQNISDEIAAAMHGTRPKLNVVMVRREHNIRVFKATINSADKAPEQNVTPGTCLKGISESETIMVPHKILKGTAKPTVFLNIYPPAEVNDLNESFLKNITHTFCYMHEICTSAIAEPHILRTAKELANRGKNNWNEKFGELEATEDPKDFLNQATTLFNPEIPTRYCA